LTAALPQFGREPLDFPAGVFQHGGRGCVRNAKIGPKTEGGAMHHGDALRLKKFADKILV
jgi:hypothetical protein